MNEFLDIRHIYLFKFVKTNKYKVGISKYPSYRLRRINEDTKRKTIFKAATKVIFAEMVEERIHRIFNKRRRPLKAHELKNGGKSAGRTEWFKLNWFQVQIIRFLFLLYGLLYRIFQLTIIIVILDILLIIANWRP